MNQINRVDKDWFGKNTYTVSIDEYDTVWEYADYEFGITVAKGQVCVDVMDRKRWKRTPEKRNQVGSFVFRKSRYGNNTTWQVHEASLHTKHQGKGLAAIIYKMLALNGYPVQSGSSMSIGAAKLWSRLASEKKVEVLTYHKGHWNLLENITPSDIYEENKLVLWRA